MAGVAFACAVEVSFAFFRVACEDVEEGVSGAMTCAIGLDAEPCGNVQNFGVGQGVSRQACLYPAGHCGSRQEENAFIVIKHVEGADQIGIILAGEALRGCAVAFGAIIREDFCTTGDRGCVLFGRCDRGLSGCDGGFIATAGLYDRNGLRDSYLGNGGACGDDDERSGVKRRCQITHSILQECFDRQVAV